MYKHKLIGRALLFVMALCILAMGFIPAAVAGEDETEILNITVGEPTMFNDTTYQNSASVTVSRTGVVAAFFPPARIYRTSTDGGVTWSKEMVPPEIEGGAQSVGLRDGGVIKLQGSAIPVAEKPDWFDVKIYRFSDDFMSWETEIAQMHVPNHMGSLDSSNPCPAKGKIIQLPSGDLLMPMYAGLKGDSPTIHRTYLVRSADQGRSWHYYASIDYTPQDSHPELPGGYIGSCEASAAFLPNGQMLAMLRTQGSMLPAQYRPMHVCWSDDLGKTWTKPVPTTPHLMNISPTLQVLDNGVVACQYGRPGFHVAFSLDNGHTWQDRISFSHMAEPFITGQFDMIKAGPNKLVAIGNNAGWRQDLLDHGYQKPDELVAIGEDAVGLKVWPITVERVKVSPAYVRLQGRVLDQQGNPIANARVERGPNRYAADDWLEDTKRGLWGIGPRLVGSPKLGYRAICRQHNHPTVETDVQGQFHFDAVPLGEMVLTVEANGYAPQWRHAKVGPESGSYSTEFHMKPGKAVRGRIMDSHGDPVPSASVVLNMRHVYSDIDGYFDWSVEAPLPQQVNLKVHKRYHSEHKYYVMLKKKMLLTQLEEQPIVLQKMPHLIKFPLWDVIPGREDRFLRRMLEKASMHHVKSYLLDQQEREDKSPDVKQRAAQFTERIRWLESLSDEEAFRFIKESQEQNSMDILCVCLSALGTEFLQAAAADSLRTLADPAAVHCLAMRLQHAPTVANGDNGQQEMRRRLHASLLGALTAITGGATTQGDDSDAG